MKYPKELQKGDLVGITALSGGIGKDLLEVKKCFNNLKQYFHLIITKDCYGDSLVSDSDIERAFEFNELLNENIKMILILRGGDFLYEVLDKLNYQEVIKKGIWIGGYSDPTTLLYILTTKYDLATIYGFNAKSYDDLTQDYVQNNIALLEGLKNHFDSYTFDSFSINGNFTSKGILIGGCLDSLRNLFGTSYDETTQFIKKYRDRRIIWYFDIYALNSIDTYLTLLQMKTMGYFKYSDTFLIGKVMYPSSLDNFSYLDAYKKLFDNFNIIVDTDIGHVRPSFTLINGSMTTITYCDRKVSIKMEKLNENIS